MKRIILILCACLMVNYLTACSQSSPSKDDTKDYMDELTQLYVAEDYYPEEQEEINAIVRDYADKMKNENPDNSETLESLRAECSEKIASVDNKEMVDAKKDAEEYMATTKTLIFPLSTAIDYATIKKNRYNMAKTPEEIRDAVDKMKLFSQKCSDTVYVPIDNGWGLEITLKCQLDQDGYPEVICTFNKKWDTISCPWDTFFTIKFETMIHSDVAYSRFEDCEVYLKKHDINENAHEVNFKSLSKVCYLYSGGVGRKLNITMNHSAYYTYANACTNTPHTYTADPSEAGVIFSEDGKSFTVKMVDADIDAVLHSDSDTFVNTFGRQMPRYEGSNVGISYIGIYVHPYLNSSHSGGDYRIFLS